MVAKVDLSVACRTVLKRGNKTTDPIFASLLVPHEDCGRVRPAQLVMIKYDAFPYQQFGWQHGQVCTVSDRPVDGDKEGRYEVTVSLEMQSIVKRRIEVAVAEAAGRTLASPYTGKGSNGVQLLFPAGYAITEGVRDDLARAGFQTVIVVDEAEPLTPGMEGAAEIKIGEERLLDLLIHLLLGRKPGG